jgi:hypothetical protein
MPFPEDVCSGTEHCNQPYQAHSGLSASGFIGRPSSPHPRISGEASGIGDAKTMLHRARMLPSWKNFIVRGKKVECGVMFKDRSRLSLYLYF